MKINLKPRTEFKLRFKDDFCDFEMILRTTEPKTDEEIKTLIDDYDDFLYGCTDYDYSPLDIMDRICEANGWEWEDLDYGVIEIDGWGR